MLNDKAKKLKDVSEMERLNSNLFMIILVIFLGLSSLFACQKRNEITPPPQFQILEENGASEKELSNSEKIILALLKAERNLLEGILKYAPEIEETLKKRTRMENAWYSPFAFVTNLSSEQTVLIFKNDKEFILHFTQKFDKRLPTTLLKDYSFDLTSEIGSPKTIHDTEQDISITWMQINEYFGYALFKAENYISCFDPTKSKRTAYFLKYCGFAAVWLNNSIIQIERCEYKASTEFLGSKGAEGELIIGPAEGAPPSF